MTLPTIPPLPPQPSWADQMRYFEAQQRERNIAANERLAVAQEAIAELIPQQMLDAPPPSAPSSGEGLTVGDVAIVKGIVDAVRPAQG